MGDQTRERENREMKNSKQDKGEIYRNVPAQKPGNLWKNSLYIPQQQIFRIT
jgi:hypothetical protein